MICALRSANSKNPETNVIATKIRPTSTTYLPGAHKIEASMEVLDLREDDWSWVG